MGRKENPQRMEEMEFWIGAQLDPKETAALRAGDICPFCKQGILDYDGMLNLVCPQCGYTEGGCFT